MVVGAPATSRPARRRRRSAGRRAVPLAAAVLAAGLLVLGVGAGTTGPAERMVFLLSGRGFGHGVGMPQYGAYGAALAGWDAPRILRHYYRGAAIEETRPAPVRVLLASGLGSAEVSGAGGLQAVEEGGGRRIPLSPGTVYRLRADGGRVLLEAPDGTPVAGSRGSLRVEPRGPGALLSLGGRRYRGSLRALAGADGLDVVNAVGLEEYLLGVVPREMPPAWGDRAPAALDAQAIAARSYALATRVSGRPFDLYADERSQVYGGVADEDPRTTAAVRRTRGRVLAYRGEVVTAFFFSSSGGRTEDGANVFPAGGARPYLASVPDPFDRVSPYHRWPSPFAFTGSELARRLRLPLGVSRIDVLRRGRSPRVLAARVATPFLGRVVSGAELRAALGLPDTWLAVTAWRLTPGGEAIPPPEDAAPGEIALVVLNGTAAEGRAARAAERAEGLGYRAVGAANAPAPAEESAVYHRPGAEGAARRVGADLGVAQVLPLPGEGSLADAVPAYAHVAVVLGATGGGPS